jgi:predicted ATPase/class 3 adenylate cyclase
MPALPSGSVTFLFTDIEGSTRHYHRLGAAYPAELAIHNRLVGGAIERNGGRVVKTEGDGFFAAFADATAAVRACVEAQHALTETAWPGGERLRVRMGLHTGPAEVVEGDYVALAVNQAARVSAAGHGDQVVVTARAAGLARSSDWAYERLGEFRLRGFDEAVVLLQVVAPGLPTGFPALRAPGVVNHNLPSLPSPLVGRDDDITAVGRLLASERMVTLVGPGGIGKTSLAIVVAEAAAPRYPGGAWWVELGSVKDADLVAEAVGSVLGVLDAGGEVATLIEHRLVAAPTLLVLDNCEHLAPAVTGLLDRVLDRCPDATVLATSRIALGQRRERVVEVGALADDAAVALLASRASDADADTLAAIAQQLDGLPLALELVGALLDDVSETDVLAGLESAGDTSTAFSPAMTASLAWSYDLLDDEAAACFRRLAVFAGACTLEAAAAVCGAPGDSPARVVEILLDLADRSLVQVRRADGRRRVHALETVRTFAAERLDREPDDGVTDRHLAFYRQLADEMSTVLLHAGPQRRATTPRLSPDVEDLRRALAHAAQRGDGEGAVVLGRVAGAVRWNESRFAEAERCLDAAIAASAGASEARAAAMRELADVLFLAADYAGCERWATTALELARGAGDVETVGFALVTLSRLGTVGKDVGRSRVLLEEAEEPARLIGGDLAAQRLISLALCAERDGDFGGARDLNSQAVALAREVGDAGLLATALTNLANSHINLEDFDIAEAVLRDAVELLGTMTAAAARVHAVANLAYLAFRRGDLDEARRLGAETLEFSRASGHVFSLALGYNNLAEVELAAGNVEASVEAYREGLILGRKVGHTDRVCYCLEGLAATAAVTGDHDRAVRLLSFAERHRASERVALPDTYRTSYEALLVDARAALGAAAFTDAWEGGQKLDVAEAVELATTAR